MRLPDRYEVRATLHNILYSCALTCELTYDNAVMELNESLLLCMFHRLNSQCQYTDVAMRRTDRVKQAEIFLLQYIRLVSSRTYTRGCFYPLKL